ncbi:hypothetical protein [Rhodocyclus tenuis]|uniref:Uncharacterized protein n=1 Tax=Rhodocyclus tenuis TaxID=1066 RepID=A0A840GE16_RHOTE|nr:hypothetical protein [Rhodocyclus tenuis]MBB4246469.1 hypothetical protein [Rhodocyclus tenuis]
MKKYRVTIKYGNPGKVPNSTQNITVEAEDETTARLIAPNKFRSSNAAYINKEAMVVKIEKI